LARALLPIALNAGAVAPPVATGDVDLPFTAANTVDGNGIPATGREILIVKNTDAAPQTVTINSAPDSFGRLADIGPLALAPGATKLLGPFPRSGWLQGDGTIHLIASAATVMLAVVRLPPVS
jgi:hypothetical protein